MIDSRQTGGAGRKVVGSLGLAAVLLGAVLTLGCGRPATHEECEEIFRRSAELELKDVGDPQEVERRIEAARAARGEELIGRCVGTRVTDGAMQCVRQASTTEELDDCFQ
jgi:hypothetical protein